MTRALVLADDATGGLECASLLSSLGVAVQFTFGTKPIDSLALVVDTESRHRAAEEAAEGIRTWLARYPQASVYKKTDSTLRGNIASELTALHEAFPGQPLFYLPAYPAIGRTVAEGNLYVRGEAVHRTAASQDPRFPVTSSYLPDLFREPVQSLRSVTEVAAVGPRIAIADSVSEEDLASFVRSIHASYSPLPPLAGPAAAIPYWAQCLDLPKLPVPALPALGEALVVCGSAHPVSREQAARSPIPVIATPEERLADPGTTLAKLVEDTLQWLAKHPAKTLIVFGGETLLALWQALEVDVLEALPEPLPGLAAARGGGYAFITKAGAFGAPDAVGQIMERLK